MQGDVCVCLFVCVCPYSSARKSSVRLFVRAPYAHPAEGKSSSQPCQYIRGRVKVRIRVRVRVSVGVGVSVMVIFMVRVRDGLRV